MCTHPSNKLLIKDGFMSTWNVAHRMPTINFWDWHLNINKYKFISHSTPDSKANNALCIAGKNPPPYTKNCIVRNFNNYYYRYVFILSSNKANIDFAKYFRIVLTILFYIVLNLLWMITLHLHLRLLLLGCIL